MRSCLPFSAGLPGVMRSGRMTRWIHQILSLETAGRGRCERGAVVAADDLRHTVLAKRGDEALASIFFRRTEVTVTAQQIAAERIHERERVAELAVPRPELPLEVDRPGVVRGGALRERFRERLGVAPSLARVDQAVALENLSDSARRWQLDLRVRRLEPWPQRSRPPRRMQLSGGDDELLNPNRRLLRAAVGCAAERLEADGSVRVETRAPLVASLARDPEEQAVLLEGPVVGRPALHELSTKLDGVDGLCHSRRITQHTGGWGPVGPQVEPPLQTRRRRTPSPRRQCRDQSPSRARPFKACQEGPRSDLSGWLPGCQERRRSALSGTYPVSTPCDRDRDGDRDRDRPGRVQTRS